jgi:tRNA threonylcarbamoyladenosine biosynthesis protein TsaE
MPIISSSNLDFISRSPEQTRRLGARLGELLKTGDFIGLTGDLGSGKTTFVQGLAEGWGSLDSVSSPTFVLVNVYRRENGETLNHMDAYRIGSALEAEDLDLDEMATNGALIVEWPERISPVLPQEGLNIRFAWAADEQRNVVFSPSGKRYTAMLDTFRRKVFGG